MKILIVAPYYAPSSEVPSVRMVSLTNYLTNKKHEVTVACWSRKKLLTLYKESELSTAIPDKVKILEFDFVAKFQPMLDDLRFGKEITKTLSKYKDIESFDVVFVTCGPYFTLKAMPKLKSNHGVKYILDFRDLGALNYRPKLFTEGDQKKTSWWKKPILNWYHTKVSNRERKAVKNADGIICVSPIDKKKMQEAYNIPDDKCIIASNGFDDIKLSSIVPNEKEKGIVGAVFGKFMYYSRSRAEALLIGIDKQKKKGVDIKLRHIGRNYDYIDEAIVRNHIDPRAFEKVGLKEYSEGMAILGASDFFVVEDTSPDDVGTKIYDYIYWNKPIIAATPKNIPLAKLVSSFEHGYVCETLEEIDAAISDIVANRYSVLDSNLDILKYSRTYQNQKMEQMMFEVVSRR